MIHIVTASLNGSLNGYLFTHSLYIYSWVHKNWSKPWRCHLSWLVRFPGVWLGRFSKRVFNDAIWSHEYVAWNILQGRPCESSLSHWVHQHTWGRYAMLWKRCFALPWSVHADPKLAVCTEEEEQWANSPPDFVETFTWAFTGGLLALKDAGTAAGRWMSLLSPLCFLLHTLLSHTKLTCNSLLPYTPHCHHYTPIVRANSDRLLSSHPKTAGCTNEFSTLFSKVGWSFCLGYYLVVGWTMYSLL